MNFFKLFRIDPEEKFKNALDIVFDGKEFEYKYLYFPNNNSVKIYINDKVAVEITYRVHTHSIYTELETSFKKELFTEYEIDFIDKYAQEFLTEKSKGN